MTFFFAYCLATSLQELWFNHYKSRASINTNALTQIRRNPDYKNCLKIAVWHHPLDSAYSDRITDQGFLDKPPKSPNSGGL